MLFPGGNGEEDRGCQKTLGNEVFMLMGNSAVQRNVLASLGMTSLLKGSFQADISEE